MTTHIPVTCGAWLNRYIFADARDYGGKRVTKAALRDALKANPTADFRNLSAFHPGTYLNGWDAVRDGLMLEVHDDGRFVCVVWFERDGDTGRACFR